MKATRLEFLVEEPSMEAFLRELLPHSIGNRATFRIHVHQGKHDLLAKLDARLRGYAKWLPEDVRIIVVVDCDQDCCHKLKQQMELAAEAAGLRTRSKAERTSWQVVNRIAIAELESWYFGAWTAVRRAYPKVPKTIPMKSSYRVPDSIEGGTWEALERIFQRAGYFAGGLRKMEIARAIGQEMDPANNSSVSFTHFRNALLEAVA